MKKTIVADNPGPNVMTKTKTSLHNLDRFDSPKPTKKKGLSRMMSSVIKERILENKHQVDQSDIQGNSRCKCLRPVY